MDLLLPGSAQSDVELIALGRAIRRVRERRGITGDELANAAGVTPYGVDALETGHLDPTFEQLLRLVDRLGTQPSVLVTLAKQLKE